VIEILATCDSCQLNAFFGVKFSDPPSNEQVHEQVVEKLGQDGAYICPRCQSLVFVHVDGEPIADAARLHRAKQAQRIGRRDRGIRFGVGDPQGARSSVWRVWMNNRRDDVYISARSLASELKVSLHPDFWYFGFTDRHAQRGSPFVPPGSDRKKRVWDRPKEFGAGWTRAFEIVVPATEVVEAPVPYTGSDVVWLPTPSANEAVHFTILLSKQDAVRGRRGYPAAEGFEGATEFVTRLDMTTGERLWVLAHAAPMTNDERVQIEHARAVLEKHGREELVRRSRQDPDFSARATLFVESEDGLRYFVDVSLVDVARAA
jgi:hypothetical protein